MYTRAGHYDRHSTTINMVRLTENRTPPDMYYTQQGTNSSVSNTPEDNVTPK